MTAAVATPAANTFSEGSLAYVPSVEIFAAGTHRDGKEYTPAHLAEIVHNLHEFGHVVKPPVKIGHEEEGEQPLLHGDAVPDAQPTNTGTPKLGTVDWKSAKVAVVPCPACQASGKAEGAICPACQGAGKLSVIKAGLKDVPRSLAKLIDGRAYDRVSAEVYDEPPPGVPGSGKSLRAVSLLGGELPQIKTLADLPHAEYSERGASWPRRTATLTPSGCKPGKAKGSYQVFAEVRPMAGATERFAAMDRTQLLQFLQAKGIDPASVPDTVPDEFLQAVVMSMQAGDGDSDLEPGQPPPPEGMDEEGRYSEFATRMAEAATYCSDAAMGKRFMEQFAAANWAEPGGGMDDELIRGSYNAEPLDTTGAPPMTTPMASPTAAPMTPKSVTTTHKFSEDIRTEMSSVKKDFEAFKEDMKQQEEAAKKYKKINDALTLFSDRITPAEMDETGKLPSLRKKLEWCDNTEVVHKFTEKGKTSLLTHLDVAIEEIRRRKPFDFSEKIRTGKPGDKPDDTEEVAKVERFSETPALGKALEAAGKTPAQYVEKFKELKKKNPALTSRQYGVSETV